MNTGYQTYYDVGENTVLTLGVWTSGYVETLEERSTRGGVSTTVTTPSLSLVDVWLHRVDEDVSGLTFEEWDPSVHTDVSQTHVVRPSIRFTTWGTRRYVLSVVSVSES